MTTLQTDWLPEAIRLSETCERCCERTKARTGSYCPKCEDYTPSLLRRIGWRLNDEGPELNVWQRAAMSLSADRGAR